MRITALIDWKLNVWQFSVQNRWVIFFTSQMKTRFEWTFLQLHFFFFGFLSFYQNLFSFQIFYTLFIQSNVNLWYVSALSKFFGFWVYCWGESELILVSFVFSEEKSFFVSIRVIEKINDCFSELIVIELSIKFVHLFKDRF